MPKVDYKKIFDSAASALDASANVIIDSIDLNTYTACITMENSAVIKFTAIPVESSLELSLPKESLGLREYMKFISRFEFNLEQKFYKNIKVESRENLKEYKIKISF